jgi:hypothetical protein
MKDASKQKKEKHNEPGNTMLTMKPLEYLFHPDDRILTAPATMVLTCSPFLFFSFSSNKYSIINVPMVGPQEE